MHPIAQILDARGITQRWLARQIQVDETLLSKYLRGSRRMPDAVLLRCAAVLQVPVSVLVSHASVVPDGTDSVPNGVTACPVV